MAKTRVKRTQRDVILGSAETLYRQTKKAYTESPRGTELEIIYGNLQQKAGELLDACIKSLQTDETYEDGLRDANE